MIYGVGYNIKFDCWKPRCSGKVDDVRGIGEQKTRAGAHRPPSNYFPRQIWDIRLTPSEISLTPGDSPPSYVLPLIRRISSSILSLPAPDAGYEDTLFFRMTRSPKD